MSRYAYASVPLTPKVFAEVAAEQVEPEAVISRRDLIELVTAHHEKHGGLPTRSNLEAVAKKALQGLQSSGQARPSGVPGFWCFTADLGTKTADTPVEVGEGPETVYTYYFPAYRDQAAHIGRNDWPMKIGMTVGDHVVRVRDQVGTAMPERATVGLIYRTDDAKNAERLLHSTLRSRGRHMADAPGTEWFMTSLEEVKSILDFATSQP